jgi:hypothetical protein
VVDLACGHGLLAWTLLLLDDSSPEAVAVDLRIPESAGALAAVLEESWPRLRGRVRFEQGRIDQVALAPDDLIVSVHACGGLTDLILDRAMDAGARVAVLPCCHNLDEGDTGGLQGWMDGPLAMDATRAARLRSRDYKVYTQTIPVDITPKNRLLLAEPA